MVPPTWITSSDTCLQCFALRGEKFFTPFLTSQVPMSKSKAAPLRRSTRQKRPALNMPLPGVAHLRPPSKTSDTDSSSDDDISLGGTPRPTSPDSSPPRTDDDHDGTFHETGDETHTVEPTTTQTTASSSSLTDRPLPTTSPFPVVLSLIPLQVLCPFCQLTRCREP